MYAILFKYYETFIASILNETDETLPERLANAGMPEYTTSDSYRFITRCIIYIRTQSKYSLMIVSIKNRRFKIHASLKTANIIKEK